ncbi:MAG: hypothetical protein AAB967_01280 [Patescibacteria group bacterium]
MFQLPFFKTRAEKFLVVRVGPEKISALSFALTPRRALSFLKFHNPLRIEDFSRRAKFPRDECQVVVSVHPAMVHRTVIPVGFRRTDAARPLESHEVENAFGQAVSRVLNEMRADASRALGTADIDTMLIASRVENFAVDGHHVVRPAGFPARDVRAEIELTFTSRNLYERLHPLIQAQKFFFTDHARAGIRALLKMHRPPVGLVGGGDERALCCTYELKGGKPYVRVRELNWSARAFPGNIAEAWGVSNAVAETIYARYLKKEISEPLTRRLRAVLAPAVQSFFSLVRRAGARGRVFLSLPCDVPFTMPHRRGGAIFEEPSLPMLFETTGIALAPEAWPLSAHGLFAHLTPFLEFYHDKGDMMFNHWLERRLHWLGVAGGENRPRTFADIL